MPVYLCHGFRWPRPLIRIHIILQNLDDAAAEWLIAPDTTATLTKNFNDLFPDAMEHLPQLRFLEQYDPEDISANAASQPYAYVADVVEEVKLGIDVDEVRSRGVGNEQWAALLELRDKLAPEEKVAWYVVVCGDEERWAPPTIGQLQTAIVGGPGSLKRTDTQSTIHPDVSLFLYCHLESHPWLTRQTEKASIRGRTQRTQEVLWLCPTWQTQIVSRWCSVTLHSALAHNQLQASKY